MALSVIIILYVGIGLMSAAGSVFLAKKLFSVKAEQTFFALFLIPIAGFYLAFTAYFRDEAAWRFETGGVIAFAVLGLLGIRVPVAPLVSRPPPSLLCLSASRLLGLAMVAPPSILERAA